MSPPAGEETSTLDRPAPPSPEDNEFKPSGDWGRVKAVSLASVLLGATLAGCAVDGDPANPNLLAPKVLLQPRSDGGVTVFVHSAFGDHDYDWMTLAVDNVTVANRTQAFSLEERIPSTGFFLTVRAGAGEQVYEMRGRVDVDPSGERARVALLDGDGEWDDPRTFNLPMERILGRAAPTPEASS